MAFLQNRRLPSNDDLSTRQAVCPSIHSASTEQGQNEPDLMVDEDIEMTNLTSHNPDEEPLLERLRSPNGNKAGHGSISESESRNDGETPDNHPSLDRSVENDVLPESAVSGRNLGWMSAYILIISRVIGSGIFATPGDIVRSTGSIGLALLLWIAGALVSWFALAISLEYGCMLPRSGGEIPLDR